MAKTTPTPPPEPKRSPSPMQPEMHGFSLRRAFFRKRKRKSQGKSRI
ncbi:MAG: hypothetical protein ABW196_01090 [Solirubrobacterales bacterium]